MSYNNLIKEFTKEDDNKSCIDCKSSNPHWASISLGVFICLDCASVHRGYGVKISKVRSIYMDNWTEEMYKVMKNGGNGKFNDFIRREGLDRMDREDMYRSEAVRKYVYDLTGENGNRDTATRAASSYAANESRGSNSGYINTGNLYGNSRESKSSGSVWSKINGVVMSSASAIKDKSILVGGKINRNIVNPSYKIMKEKGSSLKSYIYKEEEKKIETATVKKDEKVDQNTDLVDFGKWD